MYTESEAGTDGRGAQQKAEKKILPGGCCPDPSGNPDEIMEPYAEIFAENGSAACVVDYIGGSENSLSDGSMEECM